MGKVIFITNGHGEDSIAKTIINRLKEKDPSLDIAALPLVGSGSLFEGENVKIIGPRKELPSSGFPTLNIGSLFADLQKGLISIIFEQIKALQNIDADICISVGDIFPLLFIMLFGKGKRIHVGTAISAYMRKHWKTEKWLMEKCDRVFCRDNPTAEALKKAGVSAFFVGNVMMDELNESYKEFGIPADKTVVGILPSSRPEAYNNIIFLLKIADEMARHMKDIIFLISLAPNLDNNTLKNKIENANLYYKTEEGIIEEIITGRGAIVKVIHGYLSEAISRSKLILGMTGTGCEQAAGLGKPVIIPTGKDLSTSKLRTDFYKKLLGEAILTIDGNIPKIAAEALSLLKNEKQISRMGAVGRKRMGGPGGADKIAQAILEI